jgi:hypothetical protein
VTRVALVPPASDLREVLAVVEGAADVVVIDGTHAVGALPELPRVLVIPAAQQAFAEHGQRAIETAADAFVLGPARLSAAIAWVAGEDRARRRVGRPRLVVVGSLHDDFGAESPLTLTGPTRLGRSMAFHRVFPLRPSEVHTPSSSIARHHAELRWADGTVSVRDLGSTNGTLIIRRGEPGRLLCPTTYGADLPSLPWLVRDRTPELVELRIGDELVLPGFWRFRLDGDPELED